MQGMAWFPFGFDLLWSFIFGEVKQMESNKPLRREYGKNYPGSLSVHVGDKAIQKVQRYTP
jgi:hypothetical protein